MNLRNLFCFSSRVAVVLTLAGIAVPTAGRADTVVYNSIVTIQGSVLNGSATSATGNTALVADDLTFLAGYAGFKATSLTLNVLNSSSSEAATLTLEFFATDGANGGPGTLLNSLATAMTFPSGQTLFTVNSNNLFTIPSNGKVWAGFFFTGTSAGTTANLNALGAYAQTGGTVGSSTSTLFLGSAPAGALASNPTGSLVANPNGQSGNLGFIVSVPEPSSMLLMTLAGAGLAGWAARRRKKTLVGG